MTGKTGSFKITWRNHDYRIQLLSDAERKKRWNVDVTKDQGTDMFAVRRFRYIEVLISTSLLLVRLGISFVIPDFVGFEVPL